MIRITLVIILFAVATLCGRPLAADVIELDNGDIIRGNVIQMTTKMLKIRHEVLGEVEIPRDQIRGIVLGKGADQVPTADGEDGKQETPKQVIDRLVNKDFGPKAVEKLQQGAVRQSTPEDAVEQLKIEGVDPRLRSSLHLMLPGFGAPEVQDYFNGRVEGLMDGSITIQHIRKDAIGARDQLKEIMDDLGPDGRALQGYFSILDNFIQKTAPIDSQPKQENNDDETVQQETPSGNETGRR